MLLSDWVNVAAPGPQCLLGGFVLAPWAILQVATLQMVLQRLGVNCIITVSDVNVDLEAFYSILTHVMKPGTHTTPPHPPPNHAFLAYQI